MKALRRSVHANEEHTTRKVKHDTQAIGWVWLKWKRNDKRLAVSHLGCHKEWMWADHGTKIKLAHKHGWWCEAQTFGAGNYLRYLCFTRTSTITSIIPFYITHWISLNKWLVCRGVCIQKISRVLNSIGIGIWNDVRVLNAGCDWWWNGTAAEFCKNVVISVFFQLFFLSTSFSFSMFLRLLWQFFLFGQQLEEKI